MSDRLEYLNKTKLVNAVTLLYTVRGEKAAMLSYPDGDFRIEMSLVGEKELQVVVKRDFDMGGTAHRDLALSEDAEQFLRPVLIRLRMMGK